MSAIPPDMPIITLWMPWANWVSLGWKTIETRTHQRFKNLVGRRIGIHASQAWDPLATHAAAPYLAPDRIKWSEQFLPTGGAIICTAFVKEFRALKPTDAEASLIECISRQRYGLILTDVETSEAVPAKGKQGIWYLK